MKSFIIGYSLIYTPLELPDKIELGTFNYLNPSQKENQENNCNLTEEI